jgi:hypothetical protein
VLVAGFSAKALQPEAWLIDFRDPAARPKPQCVMTQDFIGWKAFAQPEALTRLFVGCDALLQEQITRLVPPELSRDLWDVLDASVRQPAQPPMPLGDAIQLARFMADVTVGYTRFWLGPDIVGGPVEVAALSRHGGFKWVSRKHYYARELNP